jgi:protein SCO1/2
MTGRFFRPALLAVHLAVLMAALAACDWMTPAYNGIDLTGAGFGRDFRLTDAEGRERTLADWRGKYVMVFFGYVYCPEVCPTALLRAAEVRNQMGAAKEKIQVITITLDPERDSRDDIQKYAAGFDPSFVGLWGTPERIKETAKEFHVYYEKVPYGKSYSIDHTAHTYIFDPEGRIRLAMSHKQTTEQYIADLRKLMTPPT